MFRSPALYLLVLLLIQYVNNGGCFQSELTAPRRPLFFQTKNFVGTTCCALEAQRNSAADNPSNAITSGLISNLAVVALKLRLKEQTQVACDVTANSSLLRGQVGPCTVKGRGWRSNLGLSCRAIEATVDSCSLDMSKIVSNQKLVLTVPGKY
jgi:hypothetical protein